MGSRPAELGHPHSAPRPAGSCLSEHPPARGRLQAAWGWGGRAAAHLPRGRRRAAGREQAPARPTPGEEPPCTKAAQCQPHAAKGRHGQLADGGQQEWGPTAHFAPPKKRVCSSARPGRLQTASPPHYFFTARTILYLINNSQVQTITFAVMVREPHAPGEGEGAGCNRYC